jgi:hypothetical protein
LARRGGVFTHMERLAWVCVYVCDGVCMCDGVCACVCVCVFVRDVCVVLHAQFVVC